MKGSSSRIIFFNKLHGGGLDGRNCTVEVRKACTISRKTLREVGNQTEID
jgi:hypothetical protein